MMEFILYLKNKHKIKASRKRHRIFFTRALTHMHVTISTSKQPTKTSTQTAHDIQI